MISAFEIFKIGIGPSSSHTVGPMKAAAAFADRLARDGDLPTLQTIRVDLFGSLAWTGKGHGTGRAVILGLAGLRPETLDADRADAILAEAETFRRLNVGDRWITFDPGADVVFDAATPAPVHPNTLAFTALGADGAVLATERWCSVGGGFVVPEADVGRPEAADGDLPYPFRSASELLRMGARDGLGIAHIVLANECARQPLQAVEARLDQIAAVMMACVDRGVATPGVLPGGLEVRRRAPALLARLETQRASNRPSPYEIMDRVSLYAIAVNEENAAGGRVVTAPTNGAAGVIPAVLRYHRDLWPHLDAGSVRTFLLTATAVGALFKMNASISGAEVGCQGEVGVASSMAAAGLAALMGGSNAQIENAAEIAMEHHLGMTCDPIGGLVQIPCIERNAFGAVKAINAASLALSGDGSHHVSLDKVIATMRRTGEDMKSQYKETSLGGLAVNFIEC